MTIKGPKGIWVLRFFELFKREGITEIKPNIADKNNIKKTDCQPNSKPIANINFASPKPIASIFLIFL